MNVQSDLFEGKPQLTAERLRELLHYCPDSGVFTRRIHCGNDKTLPGMRAGGTDEKGYRRIKIEGYSYREHRLSFLYMTGQWPNGQIDHRNNIKDDNRWANLRKATNAQNQHNSGKFKNNTSGVKGVTWHKYKRLWIVRLEVNRKQVVHEGFAKFEDAITARKVAEAKHHGEYIYNAEHR